MQTEAGEQAGATCEAEGAIMMPFTIGALVRLRDCPAGAPGRVVGLGRRIVVQWPDLDFTGRHAPESLILAAWPRFHYFTWWYLKI